MCLVDHGMFLQLSFSCITVLLEGQAYWSEINKDNEKVCLSFEFSCSKEGKRKDRNHICLRGKG